MEASYSSASYWACTRKPSGPSATEQVRSKVSPATGTAQGRTTSPGRRRVSSSTVRCTNITEESGCASAPRGRPRARTTSSSGTSACAWAPSTVRRTPRSQSRNDGSPSTGVRRTSVLTK